MKKNLRTVLCLVLVIVSLVGIFAGCGKKEGGDKDNGGDDMTTANSDFAYVSQYTSFPEEVTEMYNAVVRGDTIFFTQQIPIGEDGRVLTQEELEEIQKKWEEYYQSLESSGGIDARATAEEAVVEDTSASDVPADDTAPAEPLPEPDIEDYTYETRLFSIKKDGTGYAPLSDFVPVAESNEEEDSWYNLQQILGGAGDSLWVIECISKTIFNLPADFDPETQDKWEYYERDEQTYYARSISETGAEKGKICLNDVLTEQPEYFYVNSAIVDKDGNFYFSDDSNIYCIGEDGTPKLTLPTTGSGINYVRNFVNLSDGRTAAYCYMEEGTGLKVIDVASKGWGEDLEAPANAYNFYNGEENSDYDFYYDSNGSFMGYKLADNSSELILNWINNDIDSNNISFIQPMEDGNFFVVTQTYDEDETVVEAVNLVKTPAEQVPQKRAITLATMSLDGDMRSEIIKFNKNSPDIRIEVRDYSIYATDEDYYAGATKLNTEIISGNIPDIISISGLPVKQYAAKGLLEDLYTLMEGDTEIKKEDFVQSVLKVMETDGKLYYIAPSFSVVTLLGNPDIVGPEPGWTMEEFKSIIEQHPEADMPMGQYAARESIMQELLAYCLDSYVDWNTGKCSFNSPDFIALLEFANTFPSYEELENMMGDDYEWLSPMELVSQGRQIVNGMYMYGFDIQYDIYPFGDKVVAKGMPVPEGVGNVANFDTGMAVTTSCKDKDAAWSFIREFLTKDYQEQQWNLPINQSVFDEKLKEAMKQEYTTDPETGEQVPMSHGGASGPDGEMVEFYALTEEQGQFVRDVVNNVSLVGSFDENLMNIINEECEAFFKGEKSAEETANIIQSRMEIYVNEQR